MPAIFFALITYLAWGTANVFGTIATRKIGGYSTTFWYLAFEIPIFILLAPFFINNLNNITLNLLIFNIILGVLSIVGLVCFYEGLRIGNASLVGTITSSYALVTIILSIFFFNEVISFNQGISIVVILFGLVISSLDFEEIVKRKVKLNEGVILAVIAMFLFGIYWTFIKIPVHQIGWFWPNVIGSATFPIVLLFMKLRNIKLARPNYHGAALPILINALLLTGGSFSFNYALNLGQTAIVAPIAGAYPTIFVILAFLVFKDPITRQQIAGIITTLIGIVLLSVFSV